VIWDCVQKFWGSLLNRSQKVPKVKLNFEFEQKHFKIIMGAKVVLKYSGFVIIIITTSHIIMVLFCF